MMDDVKEHNICMLFVMFDILVLYIFTVFVYTRLLAVGKHSKELNCHYHHISSADVIKVKNSIL